MPRFASEELAEQEFTPLFESRKVAQQVPAPEKHPAKQVAPESASFALEPQPVLIEEVPPPARPAPAPVAAGKPSAPVNPVPVTPLHINFDEPFEEEYARLIPSKPVEERASVAGDTTGHESASRTEGEPHLDNLDIPAFLRRPVN